MMGIGVLIAAEMAATITASAVMFGGIAFCVWFDQRGRTRRRELEHVERMRAIELGRPLEDDSIARYQALGAIGVVVPIASLSAATVGSGFALMLEDPLWRFLSLTIIWIVCGGVCALALPFLIAKFQEKPKRNPASSEYGGQPSTDSASKTD